MQRPGTVVGMPTVSVTHFSDPGCPWAWSASPAIAALRWRYGDQLEWRHVMIGLTESGPPVRGARVHAAQGRPRLRALPALRHAVLAAGQGPHGRHVARLPGRRRRAPAGA